MVDTLPQVHAVIVNWNGASDTIECLRSLKLQRDIHLDIVIIDNASSDVSLLEEIADLDIDLVKNSRNIGFSAANNIGMRRAISKGADYVLIINNDTIVNDEHLVLKLIDAAETDPSIGLASPTIFYHPATEQIWYAGAQLTLWHGWKHLHRVPASKLPVDTGYASGCCMLVPRRFMLQVGMLSESYFLGVEDVEWSLRAKKAGWRVVYVPGAALLHKDSMSSRDPRGRGTFSPTRIYYEHRNTIWLIRQYGNWPQCWIIWPALLGVRWSYKIVAYIILRRWTKLWALLHALYDGILTEPAATA